MEIREFADMHKLEKILSNWALATGLAVTVKGTDGRDISRSYNATDFCTKLTRGSSEGSVRCERCDREEKGVYRCHAGLTDFNIPLEADGIRVGAAVGGQVLSAQPEEGRFRHLAEDLGVDEDKYIDALRKVNVRSEESIKAAVELLGETLNTFLSVQYERSQNGGSLQKLADGAEKTHQLVEQITEKTEALKALQNKQKLLALNASIEAARAGEKGAGFSVVAKEVGKLSEQSTVVNKEIENLVVSISEAVEAMKR